MHGKPETKPDDPVEQDRDADESDGDEFFNPQGEGNKVRPTCMLFIYKIFFIACYFTFFT